MRTFRPSSKAAENTRKKALPKQLLPAQGQMEEEEKEEEDEDEQDSASKKQRSTDPAAPLRKQRVIGLHTVGILCRLPLCFEQFVCRGFRVKGDIGADGQAFD